MKPLEKVLEGRHGLLLTKEDGGMMTLTAFERKLESYINFLEVKLNGYSLGEPLYTPVTLLSSNQAISVLKAEAVASWTHKPVQTVRKVSLVYRVINSEADGKVFVPVWRIEYKDADSAAQSYDCWGEINAVSGKLVNAIFKEPR